MMRSGRSQSVKAVLFVALLFLLLALVTLFSPPRGEEGARIIRGPYLQDATSTGIVIRWQTEEASTGRVWLGTALSDLKPAAEENRAAKDHELFLTGLSPDTTYYYAVGKEREPLEGKDAEHHFVTPPPPGRSKPTRIWVVGDSGTGDLQAKSVRDAYLSFAGTRRADLWLMLGDNAYPKGTQQDYQAGLFGVYPSLLRNTVLWPALGNHDMSGGLFFFRKRAYFDIFTLPQSGEGGGVPSGTEAYYGFTYGNIHFICLDSNQSDLSSGGPMLTWLKRDLAAADAGWILAYWHHPPYSKGSHDSDQELPLIKMRENALPILEAGGVDLVLTGHSHSYERSFLIDGHYGPSSTFRKEMIVAPGDGRAGGAGPYFKPEKREGHRGAVYVVAGSSGRAGGGALDYPAMSASLGVLGSVVLDIDRNRLDAKFIGADGRVDDDFSIVKQSAPPVPTKG